MKPPVGIIVGSNRRASINRRLAKALAKSAKAKQFFESLSASNRYSFLYRLQEAKKPETRARRLGILIEYCRNGERIPPLGFAAAKKSK